MLHCGYILVSSPGCHVHLVTQECRRCCKLLWSMMVQAHIVKQQSHSFITDPAPVRRPSGPSAYCAFAIHAPLLKKLRGQFSHWLQSAAARTKHARHGKATNPTAQMVSVRGCAPSTSTATPRVHVNREAGLSTHENAPKSRFPCIVLPTERGSCPPDFYYA